MSDALFPSLAKRIGAAFVLLLGLSVAGFAILHLLPGDSVAVLMMAQSDGIPPSAEEVAAYAALHGLDAPLPVQYLRWLTGFMSGEMGQSFVQNRSVAEIVQAAMWNSLALTATVVLSAICIALPIALICSLRPGSLWDKWLMLISVAGMSVPTFWYALLLSLLFVLTLGLLPSSGFTSPLHIVLPTLVAATGIAGFLARYLRSVFLEELQRPHVLAARAQGYSLRSALLRHAMPNALPQILTVVGTQVIHVFEGMLVIETIFNWPGMGRVFVTALMSRDFPVIQACFLTIGAAYILVNLIVDIAITLIDRQLKGAV